MTLTVTLLGTGSPMPSADRAGPATLISTGPAASDEHYLVDAGRGVLMRLGRGRPRRRPPHGGAADPPAQRPHHRSQRRHHDALGHDVRADAVDDRRPRGTRSHRRPRHRLARRRTSAIASPTTTTSIEPPVVVVIEVGDGAVDARRAGRDRCAPTDHKPVEPSIGYRFDHEGSASSWPATPCRAPASTGLCAGAGRARAHGDPQGHHRRHPDAAAAGHARLPLVARGGRDHGRPAGVGTLVLTHYVPAIPPGGEDDWRRLAADPLRRAHRARRRPAPRRDHRSDRVRDPNQQERVIR